MIVRFLGKHIVWKYRKINNQQYKFVISPFKKINTWEEFYKQEIENLIFIQGNIININGSNVLIEEVIYELDCSITYKTNKVLSFIKSS